MHPKRVATMHVPSDTWGKKDEAHQQHHVDSSEDKGNGGLRACSFSLLGVVDLGSQRSEKRKYQRKRNEQ